MEKQYAINLLGGTASKAARTIGCTPQAITQWKDPLTRTIQGLVMLTYNELPPSQRRKNQAIADAAQLVESEKVDAASF